MNRLMQFIVESSCFVSGNPFKTNDIQTLLAGRGEKGDLTNVRATLKTLEMDGYLKALPKKRMHESQSYVRARCLDSKTPDPLRMPWRKPSDIPNHSPVWC